MKQKMIECNIFLMIWKHIWKIPIKYTIEPHILSDLSCVSTAHVPFKWAFVKIHWHLRNTARGIVNQEKYPMDRAEYCSSFDQWDEEIWRISQLMEQRYYRVKLGLLCPVELLLCVMTVLFCVLRQLEPRLGPELGCWHHGGARHRDQAGPSYNMLSRY